MKRKSGSLFSRTSAQVAMWDSKGFTMLKTHILYMCGSLENDIVFNAVLLSQRNGVLHYYVPTLVMNNDRLNTRGSHACLMLRMFLNWLLYFYIANMHTSSSQHVHNYHTAYNYHTWLQGFSAWKYSSIQNITSTNVLLCFKLVARHSAPRMNAFLYQRSTCRLSRYWVGMLSLSLSNKAEYLNAIQPCSFQVAMLRHNGIVEGGSPTRGNDN